MHRPIGRTPVTRAVLAGLLLATPLWVGGCRSAGDLEPESAGVSSTPLEAFVGRTPVGQQQPVVTTTSAGQPERPRSERAAGEGGNVEAASTIQPRLLLDGPRTLSAMIGQINGNPVYADDVLRDLADQLRVVAEREDTAGFQRQARQAITSAVRARLQDTLILGEAERALTDRERTAVRFQALNKRDELVRRFGLGSVARAERAILDETGFTLQETLRRFRESLVTGVYIQQNLNARVNVSKREIERYYQENLDSFQPPARRNLSVIMVADAAAADVLVRDLKAGASFEELAASPINLYPDGGVLTAEVGDEPLRYPAWNAALADLEPGEWAGPLSGGRYPFFVCLVDVEQPPQQTLVEAQADIQRRLSEQQFLNLRARFLQRLEAEGSFDDPEEMVDRLVDVATARYKP